MRSKDYAMRHPDRVVIAGLCALPLLFLWDYIAGNGHLLYSDFTMQWLPWEKFVRDSVLRGEAPFWDPYLMLGFSQVGESQVGMFYPPHVLTLFLDVHVRVVLMLWLHFALAEVSLYLLLRHLGVGRAAAVVGAVSFGLSGYMLAQATNYVTTLASAYLPLMILVLTRYLEGEGLQNLALFSLALAANLCISHAGTTFMVLCGVAIYFVAYAAQTGRARFARHVAVFGGAAVLGVALAGIQVLPTLELKPLSERASALALSYVTDSRYTSGFRERLSFFFPWLLGTSRGGHPIPAGYEEVHYYAAAFVPTAALFAIRGFRQRSVPQRRFLTAIVVAGAVAFILSLGAKFPFVDPWVVLSRLPGFDMFRIPARWGCILTFALSVCAAFGLDALEGGRARWELLVGAGVGLPLLALVLAMLQEGASPIAELFAHPRPILDAPADWVERLVVEPLTHLHPAVLYALLFSPFALAYGALRAGRLSLSGFRATVVALVVLDLVVTEGPANPRDGDIAFFRTDPKPRYFSGADRYCRVAPGGRHANQMAGFPMNTAAYFGVFSTSGDTPLELRRYMLLEKELKRPELLDYLGACYERRGHALVRRHGAEPRAFVVTDVRSSGRRDPERAFLELEGADMANVAYLAPEEFREVEGQLTRGERRPKQAVRIERFENSRVELEVKTAAAGLLVMTDMTYPGWSAKLDGRPTALYAAQGAFRGVVVPRGSHHVTFEYRPLSVYYGAALSAASLLALGFAWVRLRRRQERAPERSQGT